MAADGWSARLEARRRPGKSVQLASRGAPPNRRGWLHVSSEARHRRPGWSRPPRARREPDAPPRRDPRRRARGLLAQPAVGQAGDPHARPKPDPAFSLSPAVGRAVPAAVPATDPGRRIVGEAGPPRSARSWRRPLTAVSGSPYAVDPAAGFRLQATGAVQLATLLERLRVEPTLTYVVQATTDGRSAVLRPEAPLEPGASYRFTLLDPAGGSPDRLGVPGRRASPRRGHTPAERDAPTSRSTRGSRSPSTTTASPWPGRYRGAAPSGRDPGRGLDGDARASSRLRSREKLLAGRVYEVRVRAGTGASAQAGGLARDVTFAFQVERDARAGGCMRSSTRRSSPCSPASARCSEARQWRRCRTVATTSVATPVAMRVYRLVREAAAIRALGSIARRPSVGERRRPASVPTAGLTLVFTGRASFVRDGWDQRLRLPIAPRTGWYLLELRQGDQPGDPAGHRCRRHGRRPRGQLVAWVNDARAARPLQAPPSTSSAGHRSAGPMRRACWWRGRRPGWPGRRARSSSA